MALPSAPPNFQQERAGILAVATEINRLGLIWRETPTADVGIDGQIELVSAAGAATGQLIAVQVKSGVSYRDDAGDAWRFYPQERHRFYWERFPLPVLLFLHSPVDGEVYWADVRQALRNPHPSRSVTVPKRNRLRTATPNDLFESAGASNQPYLPVDDVLSAMVSRTAPAGTFALSYLEMFALGLTNGARAIYYGMDLVMEIAEALRDGDALTLRVQEHEYFFGFVQFLMEQGLADVNISDCLTDWYDRLMQPRFMAPLTSRGRALVQRIGEREEQMIAQGLLERQLGIRVAQPAQMHVHLEAADRERIFRAEEFRRHLMVPSR